MTTLTPSQYEALPEAEKAYWVEERTATGEDGILIEYTTVMIPLADASYIVSKAICAAIDGDKSYLDIAEEALTQLKNVKR